MRELLVFVGLACAVRAEVLDKLLISVGQQVITELQLDEEIRVTAFINHQTTVRSMEQRRAAADRLIQQLLVVREMKLSHYPLPQQEAVEKYLQEVRREFSTAEAFTKALAEYNLTTEILKEHLTQQLATLQFVEYRFRPDLDISEAEIEAYYQRELLRHKPGQPNEKPPTMEASKAGIREALIEERTNQILDNWLEEGRKQVSIVYLDSSLQ